MTENNSKIPDAKQREAALDPARSFIVQAPAGSGKTELLIQRYLNLLGTVTVPEEIIARLKGAGKGNAAKEGIKIAVETIQEMKEVEGVAGVHIMAIEWEEKVAGIAKDAGLLPRPEVS